MQKVIREFENQEFIMSVYQQKKKKIYIQDGFSFLITVSTGLAQAVLFPYLNLGELCFTLPLLSRKIRSLFEPSSAKHVILTTSLQQRLLIVTPHHTPK